MKNGDNLIHSFNNTTDTEGNFKGLTKREYFAAMAMQGLLSANSIYGSRINTYKMLSEDAIAHADELLTQLEQKEK